MIEARGLTKRYGPTVAVKDLSFEVRPGRVTGFLGPNGAGKTTTMRLALGLDRPNAGSITVNGRRYGELRYPLHEVGALLDAKAVHEGRRAIDHLWCLARKQRDPAVTSQRGAGVGRVVERRPQAGRDVLARDEPAARDRGRAARRSADAALRRAGERSRPGGHRVDPRAVPAPGVGGTHRVRVEPSDERDGDHGPGPDRDRPRLAHRERTDRGAARAAPAGTSGCGPRRPIS